MAKGEVRYRITADSKPFTDAFGQAEKIAKQFTDSMVGASGSLGKIAAAAGPAGVAVAAISGALAVAGGAAVTFLANAAKGAVELGGHLSDVAAKTGISTTALQKLGAAAALTGGTMEGASSAISVLQKNLAKTPEAFTALGLSVEKLRKMEPDQLLFAVSDRLRALPSGFQQSAAGVSLMGKAWAEHAPLMLSQAREAGERFQELGGVINSSAVAALDALGDEVTVAGQAWDAFHKQLGAAIAQSPELKGLVTDFTEALGKLAQWVAQHQGEITGFIDKLASKARDLLGFIRTAAAFVGIDTISQSVGYISASSSRLVTPKGPTFDPDAARKAKEGEAAANAAEKAVASLNAEYDRMSQVLHNALMAQKKDIEAYWKDQERQASEYGKWYLAYIQARQAGEKAIMEAWEREQQRQHEEILASLQDIQSFGSALENLGGALGSKFLTSLGNAVAGWAAFRQAAEQATTSTQKATVAIEAAGSAYQSKSVLGGAARGAAAGSMFGPYGVAIGAVAGGVLGFLGKKKAQKEELADLRSEFDALMTQAQKAGTVLDHAFNPRNARDYKNAIEELKQELDIQGEAQEKLNDAVQRYGFTLDELGPVMQRQELDKQAGQLYQDWQLLNQAGIDHNAIIERMGPSINEYVQNAIAAGGEIPAAFKPIIDDLISQGKLLDENGNAYSSAEDAGITYAQTMSQMFQDLIKHVEELVNAIRGVPDKTATITVRTVREGGGGGGEDYSGGDDSDGGRVRGYASGGVFAPRAGGHVIRIAEGGQPEAVLNPAQMAAMAGGSPEALDQLRMMNGYLRNLAGDTAIAVRDALAMGR